MDELQIYGRALTPEEAGLLALGSAAIVCGTNEIRSEELYSVSVQWGSMEFVYSDGTWNPKPMSMKAVAGPMNLMPIR